MTRSFDLRQSLTQFVASARRDPRTPIRAGLGALLVANLVATWFVFFPLGGSLEDLNNRAIALDQQIQAKKRSIQKLKVVLEKTGKARESADKFETAYFLGRKSAYSTLISELGHAAKTAGVKEKEKSYSVEPIEGSGNLALLTINANYEGSYADLVQFVNQIDRSDRLMIIDALQAQPQQGASGLSIVLKLNAILREDGR
jgi:Tfp pilus assembly protein PilO